MKNAWLLGIVALLVVLAGCAHQKAMMEGSPEDKMHDMAAGKEWTPEQMAEMEKEGAMQKHEMAEGNWTPEQMAEMEKEGMKGEAMMAPKVIASGVSKYQEWDTEVFDQAVKDSKVIFIDFAANWCPVCKQEEPELKAGFDQLNNPNVVGFKVHFKDDQTTAEDTALAQQYQVPYQHTKVVLKDGKVVLKSPEAWSAARFVEEMKKLG